MSNDNARCVFCGATIPEREGNNPDPVIMDESAVCCDECNRRIVIPARAKAAEPLRHKACT